MEKLDHLEFLALAFRQQYWHGKNFIFASRFFFFQKKEHLCWLLWLIPGVRGEHPTGQLTWLAPRLLVSHICPVYLVEERYFRVIF